jgi:hypothetical protein
MYASSIIAPIGAFLLVVMGTYVLFKSIRLKSANLLFSRAEAAEFQKRLTGGLRALLVSANIFGTLTSLATVYVFFIGTAKVFGYFVFAAPLSIGLSFISTNWFTRRALQNNPDYKALLQDSDTTAGVVARMVWGPTRDSKLTAWLVKYLSLLNIASILWLEFSVAADLFALQSGAQGSSALVGAVATFVIAFSIVSLILRYGLRGYVFADLFQSPLIVLGTLSVVIAMGWHLWSSPTSISLSAFVPQVPPWQGVLFVLHVFAANIFFVLVTEGHWLRIWLFKDQEDIRQGPSTLWTGTVWAVLAVAGCLAGLITTQTGTPGVVPVIKMLGDIHPAFALLFWLGGAAALLSVSDAQIYGFVLVSGFRVRDGKIHQGLTRPQHPFYPALLVAIIFSCIYGVVRYYAIPFEKIIFILLPMCLNLLPAFLAVATGRAVRSIWTILAVAAYLAASFAGLVQPSSELVWTLAAALMPVVVSLCMLLIQPPTKHSKKRGAPNVGATA